MVNVDCQRNLSGLPGLTSGAAPEHDEEDDSVMRNLTLQGTCEVVRSVSKRTILSRTHTKCYDITKTCTAVVLEKEVLSRDCSTPAVPFALLLSSFWNPAGCGHPAQLTADGVT